MVHRVLAVATTTTTTTSPILSRFRHRVPLVRLVERKRLLFQILLGSWLSLSSSSTGFPQSNFSPATGTATSFTSTVTLPSTDGTYTIFAVGVIGGVTVSDSATVTVATTALGTLTVSKDGAQVGTQQPIVVSASPAPSSNLPFTVTSGGFRVGGGEITTAGSGRAVIGVPTAAGLLHADCQCHRI